MCSFCPFLLLVLALFYPFSPSPPVSSYLCLLAVDSAVGVLLFRLD